MARTGRVLAVVCAVMVMGFATTTANASTVLHTAGGRQLVAVTPLPTAAPNNHDGVTFTNVTFRVEDTNGNPVVGAFLSLSQPAGPTANALTTDPQGAQLTGPDGTVTFQKITLTGLAGVYVLRVTYETDTASAVFDFSVTLEADLLSTANDGRRLLAVQPLPRPQDIRNTVPFNLVFRVEDAIAQPLNNVDVTVARVTGDGTLAGTTTNTTGVNGTVSFDGLTLTGATGDYVLRVTYDDPDFHNHEFTVFLNAGPAVSAQIDFQPPTSVVRGQPINILTGDPFAPRISLRDANGNEASSSEADVTVNLRFNTGTTVVPGATISDLPVGAMAGSRIFSSARIDANTNVYRLEFVVTPIDFAAAEFAPVSLLTDTFDLVAPGLNVTQQPVDTDGTGFANPVTVTVTGPGPGGGPGAGPRPPLDGVDVTVALHTGNGTLTGTTTVTTGANGDAVFNDLAITAGDGAHRLSFTLPSVPGLATLLSDTFTVSANNQPPAQNPAPNPTVPPPPLNPDDPETVIVPSVTCHTNTTLDARDVTCDVSDGPPHTTLNWRVTVNPTLTSGTVQLNGDGQGTFTFSITHATTTQPLVITLDGTDTVTAVVAAVDTPPLPTGVPAGEGTRSTPHAAFWLAVLLLAGLFRVRQTARPSYPDRQVAAACHTRHRSHGPQAPQ